MLARKYRSNSSHYLLKDLQCVYLSMPTHPKSISAFGPAFDSQERVYDWKACHPHSRWSLLVEEALYGDRVKEILRLLSDIHSFLIRYHQANEAVEHSDPIRHGFFSIIIKKSNLFTRVSGSFNQQRTKRLLLIAVCLLVHA